MEIDKALIKRQFEKGLETYDSQAVIQKKVTNQLIQMVKNIGFRSFGKVFEVGCGSGCLTWKLIENFKIDRLIANDISSISESHMAKISDHSGQSIDFICCDAEETSYPEGNDVVFSTSTMQWFNQPGLFFDKVSTSLKSRGLFAFSTFGTNNFHEIRSLTGVGLRYYKSDILHQMLSRDFKILAVEEWNEPMEFKNPLNVLRHIKQTGVNGIQSQYFGKTRMLEFVQEYRKRFFTNRQTVKLTYHPIIIIAQKKK